MPSLKLDLNPSLYLKNPQDTTLGKKIVGEGVLLIDELGFEQFTFKKLAERIESTEATVYRYFESKHRFLVYIIAWYWHWMEFKIHFSTHYLDDPREKLSMAIKTLCRKKINDPNFPILDESVLFRIVINESDKTYLIKEVDKINKEGSFGGMKQLCEKFMLMVREINPDYLYTRSICSTVIQTAHDQLFFSEHLPRLSDFSESENAPEDIYLFIQDFIFKAIN